MAPIPIDVSPFDEMRSDKGNWRSKIATNKGCTVTASRDDEEVVVRKVIVRNRDDGQLHRVTRQIVVDGLDVVSRNAERMDNHNSTSTISFDPLVLYCIVLYCIVLYCIVLDWIVLVWIVLYYIVLHWYY